jgi:hypothetical protein
MRKRGTTLLAVVGALATWIAIPSHARQPRNTFCGSVVFLGYTNDNSGTQLATFAITNASDVAVARADELFEQFHLRT